MLSARPKTRLFVLSAALATVALAATAFATVAVYNNAFKSAAGVKEFRQFSGGKPCSKSFRSKTKVMRVGIVRGERLCAYSPPVQGDRAIPDHEFAAVGRILKEKTPRAVRKHTYLSLQVRAGGGDSYELQVTPMGKKYRLTRGPNGNGFPVSGQSNAIRGLGDKNVLRLRAFGAKVSAYVNGRRVAVLTDSDPGEVGGRKLALGVGSRRNTSKGPVGTFDNVRVLVPNP